MTPDPLWQPLRPHEFAEALQAAMTPQARLFVVLARGRLRIAGHDRPLDELTRQTLTDWLAYRQQRWPNTGSQHLLTSKESALQLGQVSHTWILNLRGLAATVERLRIDRQLEEALAAKGDPLHVAAVFGVSEDTAIRYATNAQILLQGPPEPVR